MLPSSLKSQWEPYSVSISFENVEKRFSRLSSLINEEIRHVLPSVVLAADGVVISSIVALTDTYICEVRFNESDDDFDIALLATITNYRVKVGTQIITREEASTLTDAEAKTRTIVTSYLTATLQLNHCVGLRTEINYVGEDRDGWLQQVFKAIPVDLLIKSRGSYCVNSDALA